MPSVDLRSIDRNVQKAIYQDGLADIVIGLVIIGYGIEMAKHQTTGNVFPLLAFLLLIPLKKTVTYPRIGYAKLSKERRERLDGTIIVVSIAAAFALFLGVFLPIVRDLLPLQISGWLDQNGFGVVCGILFTLWAILDRVPRMFAYAAVALFLFSGYPVLHLSSSTLTIALGGALLLYGLFLLTRFLRQYPKPSPEVGHDRVS